MHLRRLRAGPPRQSARHRAAAGTGRADRGRRAPGPRNRDREGARRCSATRCRSNDAIQQWANLGAFVDGLHRGDFALIGRSLEDTIAEPRRAPLVPGLAAIKRAAARPVRSAAACPDRGRRCLRCAARGRCRAGRGGDDARRSRRTSAASRRPTSRPIAPRGRAYRRRAHAISSRPAARGAGRLVARLGAASTGLAPDGSLYVPEIDRAVDAPTSSRGLPTAIAGRRSASRVLRPYTARRARRGDARSDRRRGAEFSDSAASKSSRGVHALELFHGPTLAFKDVGARVMARLMARRSHDRERADLGARGDVGRHRQRRRRTPSTACRTPA